MERIENLLSRLDELSKTLKSRRSIDTVAMVRYELENGFNPDDGVWLIKSQGRNCAKFADFSELETVDIKKLAEVEMLRTQMVAALREAIEATRKDMPNGESWWTYAPQDVIDKMFRIMVEEGR